MGERRRADLAYNEGARSLYTEAWRETKHLGIDLDPTGKQMAQDEEELTEAAQSLSLLYMMTGKQVFKDALDEMHAICMAQKSDIDALRMASQIPLLDAMICYAIKRSLDSGRSFYESLKHVASRIGPASTISESPTQKLKRIWMKWGEKGAQAGCVYYKTMNLIDWDKMRVTLHLLPVSTRSAD